MLAAGLAFTASTAVTIALGRAMPDMAGMTMPGGWTMSTTWMRMPGQSWAEAGGDFLLMWIVMMAAMMLPSLLPMLLRFRRAAERQEALRLDLLTLIVALAYFVAWTAVGAALYLLGTGFAAIAMASPTLSGQMPVAAGLAIVAAGLLQLTHWKSRQLACCRGCHGTEATASVRASSAWRHGLSLGLTCIRCCAPPTLVLLVLGVMDLRAMLVVGAAITAERLAPQGPEIARATGKLAILSGLAMIVMAGAGGALAVCSSGS
jgi:predicted metal-binding membrane protein